MRKQVQMNNTRKMPRIRKASRNQLRRDEDNGIEFKGNTWHVRIQGILPKINVMDRFPIGFDHLETHYEADIAVDVPFSQYIVLAIMPSYQGRYNMEIPFDIVSNGLDYRTEADWDFMHALITALRTRLKSDGSPFV